MKKQLLLLTTLLLTFLIGQTKAQVTFQKTFGIGTGQAVQQTSDKGFIVLGYALGNTDVISIVKTDSLGIGQWAHSFSSGTDALMANSVQQTNDGGYIIAGSIIYSSVSNEDAILLKLSSNGTLQWKKYFSFSGTEYGYSVTQTSDSGFVMTGMTSDDVFLVKTDKDGNQQWAKTYTGSSAETGKCVRQTGDGGYIISGFTASFGAGDNDVYVIKTDSAGAIQWTKTIGGTDNDFGNAIELTPDEGYIIAGTTQSFGAGISDVYLIKIASDGTLLWTKTVGGTLIEEGNGIGLTDDGGFIITGSTRSYGNGSDDVYLVKTDSTGTPQWTKTFGGADDDAGYSVAQLNDGGFIINGYTTSSFATYYSDMYLIKTDANGNSGCNETSATSLVGSGGTVSSGGVEGTGCTTGNLFVQSNFGSLPNTVCLISGVNEIAEENKISVFPNPFSSQTIIKSDKVFKNATLTVFNAYGQEIMKTENNNGPTIILDRDGLSSGFYFISITQDNKIIVAEKLVIMDN